MRIADGHQYYRTPEMSGGTRSYEFARRLAARGNVVDVITSVHAADAPSQPSRSSGWAVTREGGVTVYWCVTESSNRPR